MGQPLDVASWRSVSAVLTLLAATGIAAATELDFDQRVQAQQAIDRVRYRQQQGNELGFEDRLPRETQERKVRTYLKQSAALEKYWKTPMTAEALRREALRISRDTRMPQRLLELYAALDDDPVMIQECVLRPILAERLTRSFFASDPTIRHPWDEWWAAVGDDLDIAGVHSVATADPIAYPEVTAACAADDTWNNGALDDAPDWRKEHIAVWTGSEMLVWGGGRRSSIGGGTGERYDPATDTWTRMTIVGAPLDRSFTSVVWTGTEMLVWGGTLTSSGSGTNTGGRYDPLTDTWTSTSLAGAPSARYSAATVWTGAEMLVWGGVVGSNPVATGGRYNPTNNTWTAMTNVGAPSARRTTAVWTGSEMIVWGGTENSGVTTNTGGRYDPANDAWTATSNLGAPTARATHEAVWTGTLMLIWGGTATAALGGRYDPATDSWSEISTAQEPSFRSFNTTLWTGSRMVVWGGYDFAHYAFLNTGGSYDPVGNAWTPISTQGAPTARYLHTAVWTGTRMIVWGGYGYQDNFNTGGRYDPASNTWTPTGTGNAPSKRRFHTAVWTGSQMLIWGGCRGYHETPTCSREGARFDPLTASWTPTALAGAPEGRWEHAAVWTGSEMIVWGGRYINTGARYDPLLDVWKPMPVAGAPSPREGFTTVWTGSNMVVWGGSTWDGATNDGARFDPLLSKWVPTSVVGAPTPRYSHTAVWTGSRMVVFSGYSSTGITNTGGSYDPVTDSWVSTSVANAPPGTQKYESVWTGTRMLVWAGGGAGGAYDPAGNVWSSIAAEGQPTAREGHTAVWTGRRMVIWGGDDVYLGPFSTGAAYDPSVNAWFPITENHGPTRRVGHTAVWTGSEMLIWGGSSDPDGGGTDFQNGGVWAWGNSIDDDLDGLSECQGDCDDANRTILPGAAESCNARDDNCDGATDEDLPASGPANGLWFFDRSHLLWPSQLDANRYDVVRGKLSTLTGTGGDYSVAIDSCVFDGAPVPAAEDVASPPPGDPLFYLVRGRCSHVPGTYSSGASAETPGRDAEIGGSGFACP